jgi:hypothetical protein
MRKGVWHGLLTGLALLLAACGGGGQPQPDLTLAGISPQNPAVVQGGTVTLTLTFTSQNGFQGQVSLSVLEGGQPVSWLSPNAVQRNLNVPRGQQVQETLQVQVAPNAPTGSRNLTVRAAYGNQVTERALTLTVNAPPDFAISLNPTSLTVQQGGSNSTQLTITPQNGFTGTVSLSLVDGSGNSVPGITLSPTSVSVTGSGPVTQDLTVSVGSGVAPGTYSLQVQATSGSLTKTANLSLTVSAPGGGGGGGGGGAGTTWTLRNLGNLLEGVTYGNGLFVAVGDGGAILTSPDGVTWTPRTSGTDNSLYGVAHGNGLFVAVGGDGAILTSPDGVSWTARASGTRNLLYGVAYGNGLFVAVGDRGAILTSPDGVTWTQRTSGTSNGLSSVTYGNGTFVAVGWDGAILTSPDGANWTPRTSGTGNPLDGVTYGNGLFVAVGDWGTILTSP